MYSATDADAPRVLLTVSSQLCNLPGSPRSSTETCRSCIHPYAAGRSAQEVMNYPVHQRASRAGRQNKPDDALAVFLRLAGAVVEGHGRRDAESGGVVACDCKCTVPLVWGWDGSLDRSTKQAEPPCRPRPQDGGRTGMGDYLGTRSARQDLDKVVLLRTGHATRAGLLPRGRQVLMEGRFLSWFASAASVYPALLRLYLPGFLIELYWIMYPMAPE